MPPISTEIQAPASSTNPPPSLPLVEESKRISSLPPKQQTTGNVTAGDEATTLNANDMNNGIQAPPPSSKTAPYQAQYPLPEALRVRLQAASTLPAHTAAVSSTHATSATSESTFLPNGSIACRCDALPDALEHLVRNALEALDAWYFNVPASMGGHAVRQHPALAHRWVLRIHVDPQAQTISLTDCGMGMTRGDLINSLGSGGTGRGLRRAVPTTHTVSGTSETSEEDYEDEDEDVEEENPQEHEHEDTSHQEGYASAVEEHLDNESTGAEEFEESDAHYNSSNNTAAGSDENDDIEHRDRQNDSSHSQSASNKNIVWGCQYADLGGFYAALCALGKGVQVCTKSKFDDYYEAEIGMFNNPDPVHAFDHFSIRRPFPEGTTLTVEGGHDQFYHVRGESGTCVTIRLNDRAVQAGYLQEEVLRPIFSKIVETTQYTFAFSSDPGAADLIAASAVEQAQWESWAIEEQEQPALELDSLDAATHEIQQQQATSSSHVQKIQHQYNSVKERSKYIPLRLSLEARKMLRLVEAAMHCCDYTTHVDRSFSTPARRTHAQLKGVTAVLRGLVIACDYSAGQKLWQDDAFGNYTAFYQQMFEIARRHKIMNPEKMRTEYGKLIYLLQDAVSPSVMPHLGFSVKGPIESVYKFLEDRNGLAMLDDPLIETATEEILAERKTRATIDAEIRRKEKAVAMLKRKYQSRQLSADDIHLCLYSICDNNSFLNSNRVPLDKVIDYLTSHFSPDHIDEGYSLSILSGTDGSRLSHSHERQYYYALQSLTLWRDIVDDMFRLWAMAEDDLLSESVTYSLQDTGQGMQRVQPSPRTYKAMQRILMRVQQKVGHWVGSTMIHLGDHNVPNALSFIDKYTQGKEMK
jgi:hypothetical protein